MNLTYLQLSQNEGSPWAGEYIAHEEAVEVLANCISSSMYAKANPLTVDPQVKPSTKNIKDSETCLNTNLQLLCGNPWSITLWESLVYNFVGAVGTCTFNWNNYVSIIYRPSKHSYGRCKKPWFQAIPIIIIIINILAQGS